MPVNKQHNYSKEEAERALASPVQVDVVRAARLRRLAGGGKSREIVRER